MQTLKQSHDTEHQTDDSVEHFGPTAFLPAQQCRDLATIRPMRLAAALVCDFALIAVAIVGSELAGSTWIYLLAVVTIGARLIGVASVALHDGVHRLLLPNRKWNDRLGKFLGVIVGTPLLVGFSDYRNSHFAHHRSTNQQDDPDLDMAAGVYRASEVKALIGFLLPLTGLLSLVASVRFVVNHINTNRLGTISLIAFIGLLSMGLVHGNRVAYFAFWYWVVPISTWGLFVNQLRTLAEHYPESVFSRESVPDIFRTRDVINTWFDSMFVATRGVNYHLSHHLCPQVPFYNLKKLQAQLSKSPTYQQYAHTTNGYHRVLVEMFYARRQANIPSTVTAIE